jgi:hypothetical protein
MHHILCHHWPDFDHARVHVVVQTHDNPLELGLPIRWWGDQIPRA